MQCIVTSRRRHHRRRVAMSFKTRVGALALKTFGIVLITMPLYAAHPTQQAGQTQSDQAQPGQTKPDQTNPRQGSSEPNGAAAANAQSKANGAEQIVVPA